MSLPHQQTSLGPYQSTVDAALGEVARDRIMERIWAGDYTVWKHEPMEVTGRLGGLRCQGEWWATAAISQPASPAGQDLVQSSSSR